MGVILIQTMMDGNEQPWYLLKCQCPHRIYGIVIYSKMLKLQDMTWRMVWVLIPFLIVFIKLSDKKQFKRERVYSSLQFDICHNVRESWGQE